MSDYPATPQWLVEARAERERLAAEARLIERWHRIHAAQVAKEWAEFYGDQKW
jgi:hypothetical protein